MRQTRRQGSVSRLLALQRIDAMQNTRLAKCLTRSVLLGLLASPSWLPAQPIQSPTVSPIYVDGEASHAYIKVGKTGFGHEHGVTGKISRGFLRLGAEREAGSLEFDMASFVADTKDARQYVGLAGETDANTAKQVTDNMRGAAVLDVQRYPSATYVVKSALPAPTQTASSRVLYQLTGDFTLHGVTRPLQLIAETRATDRGRRVLTRFSILQSNFGITPYSKAFGAVGVADRLDIWGDVLLTTAPTQAQGSAAQPRRQEAR
jgi:polyisoprenoid-binding protein YceI